MQPNRTDGSNTGQKHIQFLVDLHASSFFGVFVLNTSRQCDTGGVPENFDSARSMTNQLVRLA
jgi:hypothetical protein